MNKIGIFYGSTSGNTETVANNIAEKTDADIFNVADDPINKISEYQNLIFGTSTWGLGDLQDDWDAFLSELENADLTGKIIAIFGVGDAYSYPDTYVDGIGIIYQAVKDKGCTIVGMVDAKEYEFDESQAVIDGKFMGLPLDEDNNSHLTEGRICKWLDSIINSFK